MQALSGFARKYAIMEELDQGFGAGSTPEAFVRLDMWEGRINASVHLKGLKQGPYRYMLYLIFAKGEQLAAVPMGPVNSVYTGMQNGLEIDSQTLKGYNVKPEEVKFAAVTAESNDKKWIPLFSSFEKSHKWDEGIRQIIMKRPVIEDSKAHEKTQEPADKVKIIPDSSSSEVKTVSEASRHESHNDTNVTQKASASDLKGYKCDSGKLETLLQNNFESCNPFKGGNRGYIWYRVNDLAKLSNIMYMSGVNVPVFANPKILVGLFRYKHILAGLYRGENYPNYFVIGVPAKDEKDNRPFENACRWVNVTDTAERDMGGYWLVYVSMKSGEIVV